MKASFEKINRSKPAKNQADTEGVKVAYYESPLGLIEIQATEMGLRASNFVEEKEFEEEENTYNQLTVNQLDEYFSNKRTVFDIPFDFEGTDFQKRVWQLLLKIPYGKRQSYMDIAKALGDPKTIRAVGLANGSNKIGIIVPCHRVVGSDSSLTGYAGGLARKKWLLDFENPPMQTTLF